jgi:hypothetical protein
MASRRPLDPARRSRRESELTPLRRWTIAAVLLAGGCVLAAQSSSSLNPSAQELEQLATAQRWNEIVTRLQPIATRSAAMDYYLGLALAQLGHLVEARNVLAAGSRLAPTDPRFPDELAGVAFRLKDSAGAIHYLRQALRTAPSDTYSNNFLGTEYFLQGNLEAALKYWNRAGKPHVAEVREDPTPQIAPALLDQAFAFSPAATLTVPQLLSSQQRVRALGVFPQFHFDLNARPDGNFDILFRAQERNGLGGNRWQDLALFFQGIPFQEVHPGYYNFHRAAINFLSMVRWDEQKRRIAADLSGPFERGARYRWQLAADLRNENWAIRNGFTGPAPVLAAFNMLQERAAFNLASFLSPDFTWSAGAELSHRSFRSVDSGAVLTPQMLATGYQLKQQAQFTAALLRLPEHRFTVTAGAKSDAARLWSPVPQTFEKLAGSLGWHWFPQIKGDDYETSQQLRAAKSFGQSPFDELFILGLERDNDLPLRAHIGTRDGRKGSAPLGRDFLLENWELDKNLYANGLLRLQLGPFADIGKITDPGTTLGSHQWLFDTGAQLKLHVLGAGLALSYGKDLRTGNNALYVRLIE